MKWPKQLDYRLSPELEGEYQERMILQINKTFVIAIPLFSICLWVYYFAHRHYVSGGNVFGLILVTQIVSATGIVAVFLRGRIRVILNYFTPIIPIVYVYALMQIYVTTLPDQVKMLQAQNWVLVMLFLIYTFERISPLLAFSSAWFGTVLFYVLQARVPEIARAESFQFNWQIMAAHGAGMFISFEGCRNARRIFKTEQDLMAQRQQSETLLRNMLPDTIVGELKSARTTVAHSYPNVTVIFVDLVGFTKKSATIDPARLVSLLNELFSRFDELAGKHGVEKIKTIGDAYMAVTGCPNPDRRHALRMIDFALELDEVLHNFNRDVTADFKIKVGMASGTVMGGVIGKNRLSFDLWGDVVNLASRIESAASDGELLLSESTAELVKGHVSLSEPRIVDLKGKGPTKIYSASSLSEPQRVKDLAETTVTV